MNKVTKPTITAKKVPPDGGYGWIIVLAQAMANLVYIPLVSNFGLIFRDKFQQMGLSATDVSLIANTNLAFGMGIGITTGPLLRRFGYRKISYVAGLSYSFGYCMTSFANSKSAFIFTYGFLTACGQGFITSSFSLAVNSYFKVKRTRATGISMSIAGFGAIIVPPVITMLNNVYGVNGCVLIIAGFCTHILVAASLLQPIKWHLKDVSVEKEITKADESNLESFNIENTKFISNEFNLTPEEDIAYNRRKAEQSELSDEEDYDIAITNIYSVDHIPPITRSMSMNFRRPSQSSINNNSFLSKKDLSSPIAENDEGFEEKNSLKKTDNCLKTTGKWLVRFFDLGLLRDKGYVVLVIGISLAIFSEFNFSMLTPFILNDLNYTAIEAASLISSLAITDIVCRFVVPFIADYFHQPPRIMYMIGSTIFILTRFGILFAKDYRGMLIVFLLAGVGRGIRMVYMYLVLPSYVPIERLASASGLQMVFTGVTLISLGPFVGFIRDLTGSYTKCIYVLNFITFLTILIWTIELMFVRKKKNKPKAYDAENNAEEMHTILS